MARAARIFISVAEESADVHAASFVRAARERLPGVEFYGLTGPRLCELGVETVYDLVSHAAMLGGVLGVLGRAFRAVKAVKRSWRERRPDLVVLLDSPELHLRLARKAKKLGLPVLYYIAPQTWASREYRNRQIAKFVDCLACILPFEEAYFRGAFNPSPMRERGAADPSRDRLSPKRQRGVLAPNRDREGAASDVPAGLPLTAPPAVKGLGTGRDRPEVGAPGVAVGAPGVAVGAAPAGGSCRVKYVGHPLFETLRNEKPIAEVVEFLKTRAAERPIVALLPGSRRHVIDTMLPKQLEIVRRLRGAGRDVYAAISCVSAQRREQIRDILAKHTMQPAYPRGGAYRAFPSLQIETGRNADESDSHPAVAQSGKGFPPSSGAREDSRTSGTSSAASPLASYVGHGRPTLPPVAGASGSLDAGIDIVLADNASLLSAADLVLVASGTATLEVAYYRKPMIVVYHAGRLPHWPYRLLGRFVLRTPHLSLVNILAGARVVPEFMPFVKDLCAVATVAGQLLTDATWRNVMIRQLDEVIRPLEASTASANVCRMMAEMLAVSR